MAITFEDIVQLVNRSRSTSIVPEPIDSGTGWALYRGSDRVRDRTYAFDILSFASTARVEDITHAQRKAYTRGSTTVVYPPSLEPRIRAHRAGFGDHLDQLHDTRSFLASFIRPELTAYLEAIRAQKPLVYVAPVIVSADDTGAEEEISPLFYLRRIALGRAAGPPAVLLAEPGQGKTWFARMLVAGLSASSVTIPVLVESSQWAELSSIDLSSLSRTIMHSFKHAGAPISWIEGFEREFLDTALRAELFVLVFDGFDEYVMRNDSRHARDTLREVLELGKNNDVAVLITSRSTFWHAVLPADGRTKGDDFANLSVWQMRPFGQSHAREYFETTLPATQVATALGMWEKLAAGDRQLAGRGFVLALVCDLVARAEPNETITLGDVITLEWIIRSFCAREVTRQGLELSADEQLAAMQLFAAYRAQGEAPTDDLLDLCLGLAQEGISERARAHCRRMMGAHPILYYEEESNTWRFRQAQVEAMLLARFLVGSTEQELVSFFHNAAAMDAGLLRDTADALVERATSLQWDAENVVLRVFAAAVSEARGLGARRAEAVGGARAAGVLLATAIDRLASAGSSREERTAVLRHFAPDGSLQYVYFSDSLTKLDLRDFRFHSCTFDHVEWDRCRFNASTVFDSCVFLGGTWSNKCESFSLVHLPNCEIDQAAKTMIAQAAVAEGQRKYSSLDLQRDLALLLGKFVGRTTLGVRTVAERNLGRGPIAFSAHSKLIRLEFAKALLTRHAVSGTRDEAFALREDAREAVRFWAVNNVFTGPIAELYDRLSERLEL